MFLNKCGSFLKSPTFIVAVVLGAGVLWRGSARADIAFAVARTHPALLLLPALHLRLGHVGRQDKAVGEGSDTH